MKAAHAAATGMAARRDTYSFAALVLDFVLAKQLLDAALSLALLGSLRLTK
jgi:hypothetical protein